MNSCKISVVIPVYNTYNSLYTLAEKITENFIKSNYALELIFIDDCSPNKKTWAGLLEIDQLYSDVRIIQLSKNSGQQVALFCGLNEASGDYVVTLDDDLQHHPDDIMHLLSFKDDADIIIGQFPQKKHSKFKILTSKIKIKFDELILQKPKNIQLSPFRVFNKTVLEGIIAFKSATPYIPSYMLRVSNNLKGVPIEHHSRKEGESGYTLKKLIKLFSFIIINNSSILLKLIAYLGLIISILSFVAIIFLFYKKIILGEGALGWTSSIVLIIFFGGSNLFAIGIVGEYLSRIISNSESGEAVYFKRYDSH